MFHLLSLIVFALILITLFVRLSESVIAREWWAEVVRLWKSVGISGRLLAIAVLLLAAQSGGSKGYSPVSALFKLLFWDPSSPWQLAEPAERVESAVASVSAAEADLGVTESATNAVATISFDWHAQTRLPFHDAQNVLASTVRVVETNISGVLYEDHYVCFNQTASTNPAVILIEYARSLDGGIIERETSRVVTNSYPFTSVINLQSGSYTCYWFRCAVPLSFINEQRDWSGEALFGAPADSGHGFDLLGTLVIDFENAIWVGSTTNVILGTSTNRFRNGIRTED
jgi:hypothetical protein